MDSHGENCPPASPDATLIRQTRLESGLSQTAAAALINHSLGAWQKWEAGPHENFSIQQHHPLGETDGMATD